jgi:hypothetical protein
MAAPVTYSISPALPGGLLINAGTGVVSGIPRAPADSTAYVITATDANGAKGTAKLTLSVTRALLTPPIIGSISGGVKAGSLQVIFTKPALAPVGQTYMVEVYDSTGSDLIKSVDTPSSPVTIDGLVPGETYQIVVVANATASYERVESLPKPGTASMTTTTSSLSTTSTSSPVAATVPRVTSTPSALSLAGIVLATAAQAASAKRVLAVKKAARSLRKAPVVRIPLKVLSRVVLPGVVYKGIVQVKIRLGGVWVPLGTARATKRQLLNLPAFSASKAGTYPIQVIPSAGGRAVYVSVAAG